MCCLPQAIAVRTEARGSVRPDREQDPRGSVGTVTGETCDPGTGLSCVCPRQKFPVTGNEMIYLKGSPKNRTHFILKHLPVFLPAPRRGGIRHMLSIAY